MKAEHKAGLTLSELKQKLGAALMTCRGRNNYLKNCGHFTTRAEKIVDVLLKTGECPVELPSLVPNLP